VPINDADDIEDALEDATETAIDVHCPGTVAILDAYPADADELTDDASELLARTIRAISAQVTQIERKVFASTRLETRSLRALVGVGRLLKDCVKAQTELEIVRAGGMSDQELLSAARKIVGAKGTDKSE
jgi:hypothetical protein